MWSPNSFAPRSSFNSAQEDGKKVAKALSGEDTFDHIRIVRPLGLAPEDLEKLTQQTHLVELELEFVPIKPANINSLTQAISQSPLQTLILAQIPMPNECLHLLYHAIKGHTHLTSLALKNMSLKTEHLENIEALIKEGRLKNLDLRFNRFTENDKSKLYAMVLASSRLEAFTLDRRLPENVAQHLSQNAEINSRFKAIDDLITSLRNVHYGNAHQPHFDRYESVAKAHFNTLEGYKQVDGARLATAKVAFYLALGRAFAGKDRLNESSVCLTNALDIDRQHPGSYKTKVVLNALEQVKAGNLSNKRLRKLLDATESKVNSHRK